MSKTSFPDKFRNFLLRLFRALCGAYGLYIILHISMFLIFGERWSWIEFLNTFAQIIWLPVFVLIPVCLIMREWRLATMMLPALIAFIWLWGALFIPNPAITQQNDDIAIRVLSYNMNAANHSPEAYVSSIRELDADIVALQELHHPQAEILITEFTETYPYMAFHTGGTQGQGIMSRYPISSDAYWRYEFLNHALGHQRVRLDIEDGTQIIIYNVHPTHPGMAGSGQAFNAEMRSREIADLLERTSTETQPILLMGDFNMPDFSADYRAIQAQFDDAFRDAGYGFGWTFPVMPPHNIAFLRLDYIFYSDDFSVLNTTVRREITGSDHNAVHTDLIIQYANTE